MPVVWESIENWMQIEILNLIPFIYRSSFATSIDIIRLLTHTRYSTLERISMQGFQK